MEEKGYEAFLDLLFRQYVAPRLSRVRETWSHQLGGGEWDHHLRKLRSAVRIVQLAFEECEGSEEISRIFTIDGIRQATESVHDGIRFSNRLAEKSGVLECLDSHYGEIVEGMRPEHLPTEDLQVLQAMGSTDPKKDLEGILYMLRARRAHQERWSDQKLIRSELKAVERRLRKEVGALSVNLNAPVKEEVPKKRRPWFKGIGQIGQGAALTIANIGLAVGVLQVPVSPETQTWGALVSSTTGVGMILTGVGELRNE